MNAMELLAQTLAMNAGSVGMLAKADASPQNLADLRSIATMLRSVADQLDGIATAAEGMARGPVN